MDSAFNESAQALRDRGYSVMPIYPSQKAPGDFVQNKWEYMRGWSRFCDLPVGDVEFSYWQSYPDAGIGLALGHNVIALDFDSDVDDLHEKILKIIPDSPCKKRGNIGYTAFYRYNGEQAKKFPIKKDGKSIMVLEILSKGNVTVLPPSIHPETKQPYTWLGTPLYQLNPEHLPSLTPEMINQIYKLFDSTKEKKMVLEPLPQLDHSDDLESALAFIDSDDYDTWIKIGMAIKEHHGESGYAYWNSWSQKSKKYNQEKNRKKWNSFRRTGIGIATVYKFAMDNGYINMPAPTDTSMIDTDAILKNAKAKKEKPVFSVENEMTELANTAPYTLSKIIDYILKTSQYPQPILALGAAIPLLGAMQSHKIRTQNNARTNVFSLGLAHSGAGKDHARQACMHLLNSTGFDALIGGDPASATGLLKSLEDGEGRRIMFIDEFGRVQEGMKSNAASHLSAIPTTLLKLFSSSGGTYHGNEYANRDGKSPRVDIDQPCLNIYATSVPSRLYRSLTSIEAIDGFLSRWLIFETNNYPNLNKQAMPLSGIPTELETDLKYWLNRPTNLNPQGNLSALHVDPKIIPYTSEALELWESYAVSNREKCRKSVEVGDGMEAVYSRLAEHAQKVALIAHERERGYIDEDVLRWAIKLTDACGKYMIESITSKISDNQQEADTKMVLETIRKMGTVTQTALCRKLRKLDRKRRNDILLDLIEAGEIQCTQKADSMGRNRIQSYSAL